MLKPTYIIFPFDVFLLDPDSSVGIATHYGLDGPGIDSRWGGGENEEALAYCGLSRQKQTNTLSVMKRASHKPRTREIACIGIRR